MTAYLIALLVGLAAGTHAATWGMYKDSIYEGFSPWKYLRSIALAALLAVGVQRLLHLDLAHASSLIILFGVTYALERGIFEFYKVFLREEDQSKYFIPMAFALGGRVVRGRLARRLAGLGYLALITGAVAGVYAIEHAVPRLPVFLGVVAAASMAGWLSALGGAWKDAPLEGFQLLKFFRSPLIALGFGLLLATLTTSYLVISFAALGFTIASIETYKKFCSPHQAPGKFAGKAIRFPEMYEKRKRFVPAYLTIWGVVVVSFVAALAEPSQGAL
jgi:hypothetical protein